MCRPTTQCLKVKAPLVFTGGSGKIGRLLNRLLMKMLYNIMNGLNQ